jgi:TRAP-type C4-dicarboxylate transport system substrate-binding protein
MPERFVRLRRWSAALSLGVALLAAAGAAAPQSAPAVRLRIVGGLAGLNQFTRHEEPFWTRTLPQLAGGRVGADIVAFDQAGLRGQEMLRLVQIGAVPFGTVILSVSAAQEPELAAPDLAGLNLDFAALTRTVAAYRPRLAGMLRERYGVELLAVYVYPAQVTYCSKPFTSMADLAGRRVRVSSPSQADLVTALGGVAVSTPFAEIVAHARSGNVDCAITGTMSGNTIGLHEAMTHVHTLPVNWGIAAFVANGDAWRALAADTRALLQRELPRVEAAIWAESERETAEGLACNTGAAGCVSGRKGRMTLVRETAEDRRRVNELLAAHVLPAWTRRCGRECVDVWQRSIAPAAGVGLR